MFFFSLFIPNSEYVNNPPSILHPSVFESQSLPIMRKASSLLSNIWSCHRGVLVSGKGICLCPPTYYGSRCQFQQSHLSVIIQVVKPTFFEQNYQKFLLVVMLVRGNESHDIIYHERATYISSSDCLSKILLTLPYPRGTTSFDRQHIHVRIDAFYVDITNVQYWSSWTYRPIRFSFLPANRLAVQLALPEKPSGRFLCNFCSHFKHHQCVLTVNNKPSQIVCVINNDICQNQCSSGSTCITPQICVCISGRLGHHCYVPFDICNPNPCYNNGQCIHLDERTPMQYQCLCSEAYWGSSCEYNKDQIFVNYAAEKQTIKPVAFVFYIINVATNGYTVRQALLKRVPLSNDQNDFLIHYINDFSTDMPNK